MSQLLDEVPEFRAFLERVYSPEVMRGEVPCEGMSTQLQALLLGMAMGMEMRIKDLEAKLQERR